MASSPLTTNYALRKMRTRVKPKEELNKTNLNQNLTQSLFRAKVVSVPGN